MAEQTEINHNHVILISAFAGALSVTDSWRSPLHKRTSPINRTRNDGASFWTNTVFVTGLGASMAVNALGTSMIVFRILKASGVKPTSVKRTLGSTGSNKFRHIMFIIIESGMALFAIQLVRFVWQFIPPPVMVDQESMFLNAAYDIVIDIN